MSLYFLVATNIFLISPQIKGRYNSPISWGPSQLPLFSHIFSYSYVVPTFYMGIGEDILGITAATPSINLQSDIKLSYRRSYIGGPLKMLIQNIRNVGPKLAWASKTKLHPRVPAEKKSAQKPICCFSSPPPRLDSAVFCINGARLVTAATAPPYSQSHSCPGLRRTLCRRPATSTPPQSTHQVCPPPLLRSFYAKTEHLNPILF
jgi:hypothetical protein